MPLTLFVPEIVTVDPTGVGQVGILQLADTVTPPPEPPAAVPAVPAPPSVPPAPPLAPPAVPPAPAMVVPPVPATFPLPPPGALPPVPAVLGLPLPPGFPPPGLVGPPPLELAEVPAEPPVDTEPPWAVLLGPGPASPLLLEPQPGVAQSANTTKPDRANLELFIVRAEG